jgi:hypothetical protein
MDKGETFYRLKERLAISIKWCAVEALEKKCFDEKTDVWSFGTVRVFRQRFTLEDAIGIHAFVPLEALPRA